MTVTETSGSKIERLRSGPVPVPCVSPADSSLQGGLSRIPGYLLPAGTTKPRTRQKKVKCGWEKLSTFMNQNKVQRHEQQFQHKPLRSKIHKHFGPCLVPVLADM